MARAWVLLLLISWLSWASQITLNASRSSGIVLWFFATLYCPNVSLVVFFSLTGVRAELKLPYVPITRVIVQELPYHMPDCLDRAALFAFGEVKRSKPRALERFRIGGRIFAIYWKQSNPRHIVILGFCATVFYNNICKMHHLTSRCALKEKC